MEKVTGIAFGLRLAVAFTLASTLSACTTHARPNAESSPAAAPAAPRLTRIVIDDDWDGYSLITPVRAHWLIEPRGSGFVLYGTRSQGRPPAPNDDGNQPQQRDVTSVPAEAVPAPAVDTLLRAMRAPPQQTIDLALFDTAVEHAGPVIDTQVQSLLALNPSQLSRQRITDWANDVRQGKPLAEAITAGVGNSSHSDDYPHARVEADFADGSIIAFTTDSQNLLMLPWHDRRGRRTYSADLPHALAALLPSASTNRRRLSGMPSLDEFDEALRMGMVDSYNRFKAQIMAPEAFASLQSRFAIGPLEMLDVLGATNPDSRVMSVTVGLPGGPSNFSLRTGLELKRSALARPAELDGMADELKIAVAATGLREAMLSNPSDDYRIEHDPAVQSFDDSAKKAFLAQMSEANELPELANHPEILDGAVSVTQDDDVRIKGPRTKEPVYWVALRDHRAIAVTRAGSGEHPDNRVVRVYDADGKTL